MYMPWKSRIFNNDTAAVSISAYLENHLKPKALTVLYNRIKDLANVLGNSKLLSFDAVRLCSNIWCEERQKIMIEYLETRENRTVTT